MNLTMKSTITELSFHTCNVVLLVLGREEPGARVLPKLMSKLQPKIAIFSKNQCNYLPSCITSVPIPLFISVIQLSKFVEKNLAYQGLLNFCHKHSIPLQVHSKWNFELNPCHKQTKLLT